MRALSGMTAGKAILNVFWVVQMGQQGKLDSKPLLVDCFESYLMAYLSKFITWWGLLTPLIALGGLYVGEVFLSGINSGFQLGFFLAGLMNFIVGYSLNLGAKSKTVVRDERGMQTSSPKRGIWLFLPMQWWSVPMFLYGLTGLIGFTGGI